jgi:PQQ-dependent dehydrogenase (methanol/ethanol family)
MTNTWKVTTSALALAAVAGVSGTAVANDDVLRLSRDPANVVMPSITYNGWNYSALDQINLNNVKNLTVAWTLQIGILDNHEASPLVVGDTMYIVSPKPNYVYALDLTKEGVIKWEFRPTMDVALATAQTCCGAQTRGLYYAEGKIFYSTLDGQNIGLDAKSGEQLWRTVGTDITRGEGMAGNNIVAGKLFIGGNEGGEFGVRGKVHAYDINTGKQMWTMYNMGPNNEVGIGARFNKNYPYLAGANPALDSWFGDSWKRGGGTSWGYFTYDNDLKMFYYSTGNCGPWNPDYRREWGKIDLAPNGTLTSYHNNFCASQMARDAVTGELIWAYNITPTDMWDLDEPLITPLLDLNIGGTTRKVAVKAARNGMFYVWDRANGKLVNEPWMHTFQDIMRGVDMQTGLPMYDITKVMFTDLADRRRYTQSDPYANNKPADYTGTEVIFCPGTAARNWENDAFSPRTNLLYTATDNSCGALRMIKGDYTPNNAMTGGYRLRVSLTGAPSLDLDGRPTTVQGQLIASDPVGRKRVWAKEFTTDANRNPILATAGDLLFQGGNDRGVLRAMNARTGDTVWEFRAGARFHQSPITYSQGGKQFVAIIASSAAANTAVAANAAPDNANRYRRSGTTLYVFKLPG